MIREMTKTYLALISVPISAPNDETAVELAVKQAHSLFHPGGQSLRGTRS